MTLAKRAIIITVLLFILIMLLVDRLTLPPTTPDMLIAADEYLELTQKPTPPRAFVLDGCSLFFDSLPYHDFTEACLQHDIAYWAGGSGAERNMADIAFEQEISNTGFLGPVLAPLMYAGVHVFGDTILVRSINANWGWGWNE
jgi:hypothetical protein